MSGILDFPGLIAISLLAIAIVLPILLRSLKQQNELLQRERVRQEAALRAIECSGCGQVNRVPPTADRALCGRCRRELSLAPTEAPALAASEPGPIKTSI